jgi:hypothetical protein
MTGSFNLNNQIILLNIYLQRVFNRFVPKSFLLHLVKFMSWAKFVTAS